MPISTRMRISRKSTLCGWSWHAAARGRCALKLRGSTGVPYWVVNTSPLRCHARAGMARAALAWELTSTPGSGPANVQSERLAALMDGEVTQPVGTGVELASRAAG